MYATSPWQRLIFNSGDKLIQQALKKPNKTKTNKQKPNKQKLREKNPPQNRLFLCCMF
jgi:hypothetical protein